MDNNDIKIIGIKTEEEALALIEKERQKMEKRNKEYEHECLFSLFKILLVCLTVVVIAYFSYPSLELCLLLIMISFLIVVYVWCQIGAPLYYFKKTDYSLPCQYHWLTNNKNILQTLVNGNNVKFILEDKETHVVSNESLNGFNTAYRTDIDNILIDLDNKYIYFPYSKKK